MENEEYKSRIETDTTGILFVVSVSTLIFFIKILAVVVHTLLTTLNLVNSRCCFAEDSKERYQE